MTSHCSFRARETKHMSNVSSVSTIDDHQTHIGRKCCQSRSQLTVGPVLSNRFTDGYKSGNPRCSWSGNVERLVAVRLWQECRTVPAIPYRSVRSILW